MYWFLSRTNRYKFSSHVITNPFVNVGPGLTNHLWMAAHGYIANCLIGQNLLPLIFEHCNKNIYANPPYLYYKYLFMYYFALKQMQGICFLFVCTCAAQVSADWLTIISCLLTTDEYSHAGWTPAITDLFYSVYSLWTRNHVHNFIN